MWKIRTVCLVVFAFKFKIERVQIGGGPMGRGMRASRIYWKEQGEE